MPCCLWYDVSHTATTYSNDNVFSKISSRYVNEQALTILQYISIACTEAPGGPRI